MSKFELLCQLKAISEFAYDIHYTAEGRNFYSDHIFSERLADVDVEDDFIETLYLGESEDAPSSVEINEKVASITPEAVADTQTNFKALREMIVKALMMIEKYKFNTKAEEDLLGSVAHILQRHNGLLFRQLRYTNEEIRNSDDEIDYWFSTKSGAHIPVRKGQTREDAINSFFEKKSDESVGKKAEKKRTTHKVQDVSGLFGADKLVNRMNIEMPEIYKKKLPLAISEALFFHEQNNHYNDDVEIPESFDSLGEVKDFIKELDIKEDDKRRLTDLDRLDGMFEKYKEVKSHFENPPSGDGINSYGEKIKGYDNFKKWYGDSKALDKNGNPLVLFHGSPQSELEKGVFDFKHKGRSMNKQKAFFSTTREDIAESYTKDENGKKGSVHKVYAKIERPLIVDFKGHSFLNGGYEEFELYPYGTPEEKKGTYGNYPTIVKRRSNYGDSSEAPVISKIVNYAKKNGYDGVIAKNISDIGDYSSDSDFTDYNDDYIVFDPKNQLKSVDNDGEWSGDTLYNEK